MSVGMDSPGRSSQPEGLSDEGSRKLMPEAVITATLFPTGWMEVMSEENSATGWIDCGPMPESAKQPTVRSLTQSMLRSPVAELRMEHIGRHPPLDTTRGAVAATVRPDNPQRMLRASPVWGPA